MREVLFRGKTKNGEWVYGFYGRLKVLSPSLMLEGTKNPYIDTDIIFDELKGEEIDKNTLGEYTGLKDKNGNKIFEGDLIDDNEWSVAYCDGEGEFCGMQAGWYVQRDAWESWYGLAYDTLAEVIGNIHDNN